MRRLFGRVVAEHGKMYFKVLLNRKQERRLPITILQEKENETLCSKCETNNQKQQLMQKRLCYKLVRGIVFPEQLEEIVRDQILKI